MFDTLVGELSCACLGLSCLWVRCMKKLQEQCHSVNGLCRHQSREMTGLARHQASFLRHNAVEHGIGIEVDGYCRVDAVLAWHRLKFFKKSFVDLHRIVGRTRSIASKMQGIFIRAVQGYSITSIDDDELLVKIGDHHLFVCTGLSLSTSGFWDPGGGNHITLPKSSLPCHLALKPLSSSTSRRRYRTVWCSTGMKTMLFWLVEIMA